MYIVILVIGCFILSILCLAIPILTACAVIFDWPALAVVLLMMLSGAELGHICVSIITEAMDKSEGEQK